MIAEIINVSVQEIKENPWNPNEQNDIVFNELVNDINNEGFDEAIQVVEIPDTDPDYAQGIRYMVIGGAHRLRAVKALNWKEIPVVIKDYDSEEEQKIKTVRRNLLKGELNRIKFTQLIHSLDRRPDNEFAVALGLSSNEALNALIIDQRGEYSEELAQRIEDIKKEEVAIKNLSMILNKLFTEYGETVLHSYMFFTYGTKLHLMVLMSRELQKKMHGLSRYCEETDKDINEVLEKIIEIGIEMYKNKGRIIEIPEDPAGV